MFAPLSAALLVAIIPSRASARLLEIIHTNDLHSHFEHSDAPGLGGYAAVKAMIDELKGEAESEGVDTLTLDAGDFNEGTEFYLAGYGLQSFKTMDAMGYDAVTIGNHDWLMGPDDLDRIVGEAQPGFQFLGANFYIDSGKKNLQRYLHPYAEFDKAGVRLAVLGLTTDDFLYSWRADEGIIFPPTEVAHELLPKLRSRNDFVIALTHLGVSADHSLAMQTGGIDLIVGGHSHTLIPTPEYVKDRRGRQVPIVQTGAHGEYVGDMLVDLEPGKPLQVLRYQLHPVVTNGPQDTHMSALVADARRELEQEYGRDWLYKPIGYSEVPMEKPTGAPSPWGDIVDEGIRQAAKADLAIDETDLFGDDQPAGPVNREGLFLFYPRVFDLKDRFGWTVWTVKIRGWILDIALKEVIQHNVFLNLAGVSYDLSIDKNGKKKVKNLKFNGHSVRLLHNYTVALPEGIARGAYEISPLLHLFLKHTRNTHYPMLFSTEDELQRIGGVVKAGAPATLR